MSIGFIGLGSMGQGMARNLLKSGVDLIVFDNSPEAMSSIVPDGAKAAGSVTDLASRVRRHVHFASRAARSRGGRPRCRQCPTKYAARLDVVRAFDEFARARAPNTRRLRGKGQCDARRARQWGPGRRDVGPNDDWVGGDRAVFDRHLDLLRAFANAPHHMGAIGAGTVTKLTHNMVGYMITHSLAEWFSMPLT